MENSKSHSNKPPTHAPGTGSDKQHPETPPDANERERQDQMGSNHRSSY